MDLDSILKDASQIVTIMTVCTQYRAQAHKFLVTDGMVHYHDELLTPIDAYRRFLVDYHMFNVVRCDVIHRVPDAEARRGYRWTELERLDK
jgi:hypothetical protein